MAAKFTAGDSIESTRNVTAARRPKEPRTSSESLRAGSTMPGMPGPIGTSMSSSSGKLRGGKGMTATVGGPKSVGQRGGTSQRLNKPGTKAAGTMMKGSLAKGGAGKMESMRGRTMTKAEGRRGKSVMY